MSTPEEIADCLERAADLIEVHGWAKGVWFSEASGDGLCAMHAINRALGFPSSDDNSTVAACPAAAAAERAMTAAGYGRIVRADLKGPSYLWAWNDERERTEFEVIDALRLTAKGLRPVELPDPHDREADVMRDERYAR